MTRQFYSYLTTTPDAPGMTDEPVGSGGRSIDRDLKTLRGVVNRLKKAWPGKSFKVFSFTNFYDDQTFRLVHVRKA
jgi:uncharacterized protein YukE